MIKEKIVFDLLLEKEKVATNRCKLWEFLKSSEFEELNEEQQSLIERQVELMDEYILVIKSRVDNIIEEENNGK